MIQLGHANKHQHFSPSSSNLPYEQEGYHSNSLLRVNIGNLFLAHFPSSGKCTRLLGVILFGSLGWQKRLPPSSPHAVTPPRFEVPLVARTVDDSLQARERSVACTDGGHRRVPLGPLFPLTDRGPVRMRSLVVQDEALPFYTRTPGFSWT